MANPAHQQQIKINGDKLLFPDDTGVAFMRPQDIIQKLDIYDQVTSRNHLLSNWGGGLPYRIKRTKTSNATYLLSRPYGKIQCDTKGEYFAI